MKQIFTFLILIVLSVSAFSQNTARMSITALLNGPVTVVVDNRTYQINNDRTIVLNDIASGSHFIRIYKQGRYGGWKRNNNPLYESNLFVRRGMFVDIVLNRFGKVFIDEQPLNGIYSDNNNWNDGNNNDPLSQAMSATSFGQLKQTLSNESYDNTRLVIAKQAASVNKFSAQQAKEIVMLFTYESNKVDMAKNMYANTIDKNNYLVVYDAFTYSSSKEELARYIQQYR